MSRMEDFIAGLLKNPSSPFPPGAGLGVTPGWDSFTQLSIMIELESRFGIDINDESIRKYSYLKDILLLEPDGDIDA